MRRASLTSDFGIGEALSEDVGCYMLESGSIVR